jgi:hypothetical protein
MTRIDTVGERLQQASDLAAVLDACYEAFEWMLSIIQPLQDPASGWFTAFVMAAASAADGRDALLFAASLPGNPLPAASAGQSAPAAQSTEDVATAVAGLSLLAAGRLARAAASARDGSDRSACQHAIRCAQDICELLSAAG